MLRAPSAAGTAATTGSNEEDSHRRAAARANIDHTPTVEGALFAHFKRVVSPLLLRQDPLVERRLRRSYVLDEPIPAGDEPTRQSRRAWHRPAAGVFPVKMCTVKVRFGARARRRRPEAAQMVHLDLPEHPAQRGEASSSPTPRAALRSNARRSTGRDRDTGIVARDRRPAAPNRSPVEGYPANLQRQRPKSRYGSCALRRFSRRRRARSACRSIATR